MKFCIATVDYWESVGFDTTNWRKSTDGLKAMCHDKFARTLVNIKDNENVATYDIDSEEFAQIISNEFTDFEDEE